MEIYSALKAAWHTHDIARLRAGEGIVPHQLYLIVSDLCNQDCDFCTYRSAQGWGSENFGADTGKGFSMNPNRKMPTAKAVEILDDCAELGVRAVQFTGGGEPTVHPDFKNIVGHALKLGLEVGLVTNGTKRLPDNVASRVAWIRVSVDAGMESTYERTRHSKLWPKMLDNLRAYSALAGPRVGASFVTTRDNYGELFKFCDLMKSLGVPYVKISANLSTDGVAHYDGILDDIMRQVAAARRHLANGAFKIVNVFERRLEDLRIGRPLHAFCGQQRFAGYIGGDLKVYRCCNTAYTKQGEIGDLSRMRYKDWLKGSSEAFDNFDARSCRHCQFHDKNETIAYLIQQRPEHVEFV